MTTRRDQDLPSHPDVGLGTEVRNHIADEANPHAVTAAQVGAASSADLAAHEADEDNPHSVSLSQAHAVNDGALSVGKLYIFTGREHGQGTLQTSEQVRITIRPFPHQWADFLMKITAGQGAVGSSQHSRHRHTSLIIGGTLTETALLSNTLRTVLHDHATNTLEDKVFLTHTGTDWNLDLTMTNALSETANIWWLEVEIMTGTLPFTLIAGPLVE